MLIVSQNPVVQNLFWGFHWIGFLPNNFRQILKEYVGFKILSFIYNANKSQEKKAPSHCSLSTYAQHLRIHWGNLVCQNDKNNIK